MILNKFRIWKNNQNFKISQLINYLFIGYAFAIPISGTLTEFLFSAIFVLWFLEGNIRTKVIYALNNKFIQALLLFFTIHILWLWSSEQISYGLMIIKSIRFLLYPIIYISSIKKEFIFKILNGFIYAMVFSEITSYLIHFQIIEPINNATVEDPVPFALWHTNYALYLGLSVGLMLFMSSNKNLSNVRRFGYILFFITASTNIFIIGSRLGFLLYITSILIVLIFIYKRNIIKILFIALFLSNIAYFIAYTYSPLFKTKITQTITNTIKVIEDKNYGTSLGNRVGHWYYSFKLIRENFFFGIGEGDQIIEFKKIVIREKDPHKDFLIHNVQNGIHSELMDTFVVFGFIGFIIYLNMYYQLYKYKPENKLFHILQLLIISVYILSAIQGGAIVLHVKDLGKLFTLLSVLIIINATSDNKLFMPKT